MATFAPWAFINTCLDGGVAYRPPVIQPNISSVSITIRLTNYTQTPIGIFCIFFLSTFPKVPTRRIRLTIKSFFCWDHFLYSRDLNEWFVGDIVRRNKIPVTLGSSLVLVLLCLYSTVWCFSSVQTDNLRASFCNSKNDQKKTGRRSSMTRLSSLRLFPVWFDGDQVRDQNAFGQLVSKTKVITWPYE